MTIFSMSIFGTFPETVRNFFGIAPMPKRMLSLDSACDLPIKKLFSSSKKTVFLVKTIFFTYFDRCRVLDFHNILNFRHENDAK